ncbi:unnamed protein product [Closterium sp. NIES-54]
MASLRVLTFDHKGHPIQFDTWLNDLQLYLLSDSRDSVSLFDHTSGASFAPPATADSAIHSQWLSRDAAARLAIRNHLPLAECPHFRQHKTAKALYDAVVAHYSSPATTALGRLILPYLYPELSAFPTVEDLVSHLRTSDARYRAALLADAIHSQWLSRDAAARLAIRNHLPLAECPHFRQHKTAKALYDAVVAHYSSPATTALGRLILPYLYPELSAFPTVEDLVSHLRTSDARYRAALLAEDHFLAFDPTDLTVDLLEQHLLAAETRVVAVGAARGTPRMPFFEGCSPSPLAPSYISAAVVDVLGAEDVGAASASEKRGSSKGKGGRSSGGGCGGGSGGDSGGGGGSGGGGSGGSGGGSGGVGGGVSGSGGSGDSGGSGSGGSRARRRASGGSASCPYVIRRGEFSSDLLREFCRGEGILKSFTLPASPQQNGIAERLIGLVMEVARTSMIHAAAPHFMWPFAVRYAAHQLNLWPRDSLPKTSPTLRWTGKVGDASVFRVWGSHAFVRDMSADKLSACAIPCVFLGFPPDAPGWKFYHPTSRCVLASQGGDPLLSFCQPHWLTRCYFVVVRFAYVLVFDTSEAQT